MKKLIDNPPIYHDIKHKLTDVYYANYGTQNLDVSKQSMPTSCSAFCIIFILTNILVFIVFLICAVIDSIIHPLFYSNGEEEALIRGGELLTIIIICCYTLMIPILALTWYLRKHNVDCYKRLFSEKTACCLCELCLNTSSDFL